MQIAGSYDRSAITEEVLEKQKEKYIIPLNRHERRKQAAIERKEKKYDVK